MSDQEKRERNALKSSTPSAPQAAKPEIYIPTVNKSAESQTGRDELVEAARAIVDHLGEYYCDHYPPQDELDELWLRLRRALAAEGRKSESTQHKEWVSVSERLPNQSGEYWVSLKISIPVGEDFQYSRRQDTAYFRVPQGWRLPHYGRDVDAYVTHWQPLPAPPDTSKGAPDAR
jgi:hypothetical protein